MSGQQQYDAFISYRHLPLDRAVAERVQTLLESYKVPLNMKNGQKNKIGRIFRDQSELPTSGNLDDALKRALEASQFLIVVLSRQTKDSKWCMEEIRSFKEAHEGRISHILPILVDGEPDLSIPDILRYETRKIIKEDGTVELQEVEVEPLCCDVRSDSIKGSLKKLKTEFLRLCAPMLGVGFDDLYQRHTRRRKKITLITTTAASVLTAVVLSIILSFAYQTYRANQEQMRSRVDNYAKLGASQISEGDYEQALMYFSEALSLDNKTQAAKTGALLLLQQYGWLNHTGDGNGWIADELLYDSKQHADAIDSTKEKLLHNNENGVYTTDKNGTVLEDLSAYGGFISAAQDGSCWTFATDDTITFYFTADSSVAQVERPKAINPKCDPEDVEFNSQFGDNLFAMAANRTRAVICYGGYLYIYNLNENNVRGELCKTFDLSLVFENFAKSGNMTMKFKMWVDAGGKLCVISGLNCAAVFNVTNEKNPCLNSFSEFYGRTLQDVVFSSDGQYYAMVYGNDAGIYNNPGGNIEVYNQFGKACMATDFDGNTPLSSAAFETDSNRIAAWGNGELQIWNWSTGAEEAAPIKIDNISSAVWLEDGTLAVSDGNGAIRYYSITYYEASNASIKLEDFEEQDYRQDYFEMSSGYNISYDTTNISVTDSNGEIIDERDILELNEEIILINRMFVDDKHNTAYLWNSFGNSLSEVRIDKNGTISSVSDINTQMKNPLALYSVWNGVLAEMGTGELFYYENGQPDAVCTLTPCTTGSIQSITSNESGLVSFVIRNQQYTDGYSYKYTYSVELWDLNKNVMLAELKNNSKEEITSLTFSSNEYLAFMCGNEIITWCLDAPAPNSKAIATMKNMSCYSLNETHKPQTDDAAFDAKAFGNWNNSLHIASEQIQEPDITFTEKMDNILEEKGEDIWLNEYNKWWSSDAPEATEPSELNKIMENYFTTAKNLGYKDELHPAVEKYIDILCSENLSDTSTTFNIYDILLYTPENAELVVKYYEQLIAAHEQLYKENGLIEDMIEAFSYRVCAGIIQGKGINAFEVGDDVMGGLYKNNIDALMQYGFQIYADLLSGKPEEAAKSCDAFLQPQSAFDYYLLLRELAGYVSVGAISEADYSAFVGSLKYPTGIRIAQVTSEQLEAGLRLGDVVTAVNGIHFGIPQYYDIFREENSVTSITVSRNDSVFTINVTDDLQLAGGYPT